MTIAATNEHIIGLLWQSKLRNYIVILAIYPFYLKMHDSAGIRNAFRQGID